MESTILINKTVERMVIALPKVAVYGSQAGIILFRTGTFRGFQPNYR
jgi:hypothetical protein